jgi:hypothetical protein
MSLFLHLAVFPYSSLPVFTTIEEIHAKVTHILYIFERLQPCVMTACNLVDM